MKIGCARGQNWRITAGGASPEDPGMLSVRFLKSVLPASARSLIRAGRLRAAGTSAVSQGFKQANIVIVNKQFADDFEKFCLANNGPLPLLYRSKPGEWSSPILTATSDIRTDCPQYRKYEGGNVTGNLNSLVEYTQQLKDMVTFYLGCSFSFESAVLEAGVPIRNVEQGCNVSMYKTSIPCIGIGSFQCNMVVTMRPIPVDKLEAAVQVTHPMEDAHGAPVHIGHPGIIGIEDLSSPDFGDAVEVQPGDALVFWACGVTGGEAVRSCSNRGIKHLLIEDELLKASLSLSHAKSVLITTGFPTHFNHQPPEETDGPPGAIAMAAMLQALKKSVVIVTDQRALKMNKKIIEEAVEQGVMKTPVPIVSFQDDGEDSALKFLCHDGNPQFPRFDHLIAIERAGMAADGNYYNARKVNIKHLVDPIDKLFQTAEDIPGIVTTGIGDGGNELGMGKVKEAVKKYIHNGDLIACDVKADFAVIAGVSNWGGYAVACALYTLNTCTIHERYLRKAVGFPKTSEMDRCIPALPTVSKEEKLLEVLVKHGIRSGKTGNLGMEVDGLLFHDTHSSMINQLMDITLGQVQSN
ncbi:D-glutamate cyclase, mitochondrial isoform X3 [Heptranchias perlo]|uniref:D-glutamate cyclase, mitochondrial isoform X3 n=1 Tax=Heptranchias perlo TaxID=212740 RepID=UPI00355A267A